MAQRVSYDDVYKVYAWREDNIAKLVLTQGEGLSDSASSFTNTYVKTAKFQLRDDRGVIAIPSNNSATLALEKSDGSEALIEMFTSYTDSTGLTADKNNGIVTFAIKRSMTDVPGEMKGEIRLTTSTGIIKFYGIKFYVYNGISDAAAEQSEAFSALVSYTNKVAALLEHEGDYGNLASLDDTIVHGGVNPATSGVIFDFVDGNYMRYKSISGSEADTANDARTIYIHHANGGFRGLVFFVGYNNYNVSTTVRQFRLCKNGRFEYRDGTVITPTVTPNTYTWDKTYDEDWKPIGSTQNIQDLAVTTAKLANQAVTSAKIGSGEVKTTNIDSLAVTTSKIANGAVTFDKMNIDNPQALAKAISEHSLFFASGGNVPTSSETNYPIPMLWYNSTSKVAYLIYNKRSMGSGSYGYDSHIIPRFTTQRTFNNQVGVEGQMIYSTSDHKLHLYDSTNSSWTTFVTEEITIAGLSLSESITIDDLMDVFEGKIVYQYEYEYNPPSATSNKYHYPAIWRNTTDDSTFLIYKRTGTSSYHYYATRIPKFHVYTSSLSGTTMSGVAGQMAYSTVDKTLYICDGSSWAANVTELRTIAGISLSSNITAEQLSAALSGHSLCWHESEYSPNVVTGEYSFPAIWHNTTNDTYYIVYDGELTSNDWSYSSYQIPKATSFFNQFDYHSGVACEVAVVERTGEIFVCMGGTSWEQVITKTYLDAGNYVHSHFHRGLSGTWRPTTSDEGTIGEMWWTVDEEGKYICYQLVSATGSAYYWKPLNENNTPQIYIGTTDKPNLEIGNDYELWYHKHDRYINKKNGKLWVCTLVEPDENMDWSYSWSLKGNLYNYSAVVDYPLQASSWNNNQITLSGQLVAMADGRTRVDVDFDESTYLQLCADGCGGLYVTTDDSGAQTEFVIHAINNPPTQNITVQLTLSQVIEW